MRALLCAVLLLVVVPGSAEAGIKTLSTRPDMVTGGDVLVKVARHATLRVNGRVIVGARRDAAASTGPRTAATRSPPAAPPDRVNHPITGPVFSGPHEQPFVCETEAAGLGAPLDADCSVATRTTRRARTASASRPARSTAASTRSRCRRRLEPAADLQLRRRLHRRLVPPGHRRPAACSTTSCCSHGYAVASSSLNVFGNNCQEVTAAETMMMVKEHFIETYGVPGPHAWASGCSGGSYQQHQIADNYPGLLDGILPGCSFPEVTQATVSFITDALAARPLLHAARRRTGPTRRSARSPASPTTRPRRTSRPAPAGSTRACSAASCRSTQRYDPVTNPDGARCDLYDHAINVWGRDPDDRLRAPPARQRRHPVRPEGAQRGRDHGGPVPRSQRAASAASTPTRTSSRSARSPTRSRCAAPTAPAGSPTAACGLSRHPDHRLPRLQRRRGRTATSTCATTRSRCATAAQGQRHARATR